MSASPTWLSSTSRTFTSETSAGPSVIAAATETLSGYGLGATGSRLVRGSTQAHADLESELAADTVFARGMHYDFVHSRSSGNFVTLVVAHQVSRDSLRAR
mgnify:CR=1 FL=1